MASELTRREPVRELGSLRDEMERMFRQAFGGEVDETSLAGVWSPMLDVEETDDAFEIHVETPGVKPEDIEITLEDGVLGIRGERRFYEDRAESGFRRVERRFGRFHRALRLPTPVDADGVEATCGDGMLRVRIPKAEAAKPRRIEVRQG